MGIFRYFGTFFMVWNFGSKNPARVKEMANMKHAKGLRWCFYIELRATNQKRKKSDVPSFGGPALNSPNWPQSLTQLFYFLFFWLSFYFFIFIFWDSSLLAGQLSTPPIGLNHSLSCMLHRTGRLLQPRKIWNYISTQSKTEMKTSQECKTALRSQCWYNCIKAHPSTCSSGDEKDNIEKAQQWQTVAGEDAVFNH